MSRPTTAPSVISSSSSLSSASTPESGLRRDQHPRHLYLTDRRPATATTATDSEESRADPFQSPESSIPPTPRSHHTNPFSAPPSILNFNPDLHSPPNPSLDPFHGSRPHSSRRSSRRTSAGEFNIREVRSHLSSRVTSQIRDSFMSPPVLARRSTVHESNATSRVSVAGPKSKRLRSTMLTSTIEKPWIGQKDVYATVSYWLTLLVAFLGVAGSALLCYFSWKNVPRVGNLCLIMEDNFDKFDTQFTWQHEVDMGGFGFVGLRFLSIFNILMLF